MAKNSIELIYDLCNEYYNNEKLFQFKHYDKKLKCYLIDKDLMEPFLSSIYYHKLKPYIKENYQFKNLKETIKKLTTNNNVKIKKNINQKKFNNKQELIISLNNNKIYYIVNSNLWVKICKKDNIKELGTDILLNKDKISIIFNENEKLDFKWNKYFIDKSSLINDNIQNIKINLENKNIENKNINNNNLFENNNFKNDLEILIRLFYYNKEINKKSNISFKELNNDDINIIYLINNKWIEKYKLFYEYNELEYNLINLKNKDSNIKYTDLIIQNNYFISDELIKKIILNLPNEYINKIIKKDKFNNINEKLEYHKIEINKKEIRFLINNQIINQKIYTLLMSLKYGVIESIKECKCYFIGNKKLLILFKSQMNKDNDEIGYINDNNIFIPQFILDYNNSNDISLNNINIFLNNNFQDFQKENNKKNYEIINEKDNSIIGYCYKLNNNIDKKENNNILENGSKNDESKIIEINNNNLSNSNNDLHEYYKKGIEIILLIYEFNQKIKNSLIQNNNHDNIINTCYLVNKEWLNNFKNIYLYNEIHEYIQNRKINLSEIKTNSESYDNLIKVIYLSFQNEFLINKNDISLNEKNYINCNLSELSMLGNIDNIYYPNDFYIINKNIYKKLYKNNFINNNILKENLYIIINNKIIFKY